MGEWGWTNYQMDRWMLDRCWMDDWMDGWRDRKKEGGVNILMDGWVMSDSKRNGQMKERWIDRRIITR